MSLIVIHFPSDKKKLAVDFTNRLGMESGHIHGHSKAHNDSETYKVVAPKELMPTQKMFVMSVFEKAITELYQDDGLQKKSLKELRKCYVTWHRETSKQLGGKVLNIALVNAADQIFSQN